jgi:dihydroorotate dehydrogenase electron transfer subunit
MKRFITEFTLTSSQRINHEYVILTLQHPDKLPPMEPGQFVEVRVNRAENTFLRRPISIHDVDYPSRQIKLLIQEVGEGTRLLCSEKPGSKISLVYPLGRGFTNPPSRDTKLLLIGGGCGIAPMLYLGKELKANGYKPEFLFGARTAEGLLEIDKFEEIGPVYTTTEDGSHGTKGYVIHHPVMRTLTPDIEKIYTCGPEAMMRVIAKYAKEHGISCEVSLENTMACGFGVCLCCVTDTTSGHKCVCTEGPVFDTKELKW